jgi:hypothetical protein
VLFRCDVCGDILTESEIIQVPVPHPKRETYVMVNQCPECGECEDFTNICDAPFCEKEATCGWPSESGYRRTCGEHMRNNDKQEANMKTS